MNTDEIRKYFHPLFAGSGGIDSWLNEETPKRVFDRLASLDDQPLTRGQLNQLLVLSHEAGMSDGFFRYYWLAAPDHPYEVRHLQGFSEEWTSGDVITSLRHLRWGMERFYVDALLYFGNIRTAYRTLRDCDLPDLVNYFAARRVDTEALVQRGPALELDAIPRDQRYLISEMACKSLGQTPTGEVELRDVLVEA